MENEQGEIDKNLGILAKSSMVVFIGLFLSKLFTYLYRITIARYYGPEIYGLFSLSLVVVAFFIAFSSLGLIEGLTRFIPIYRARKEKEKIKYLLKISNIILFISGIFSAVVIWFLSEFIAIGIFHDPNLTLFLKIFAVLVPISIFSNFYFALIRSYEKISAQSFGTNILQNLSKLLLIGILIFIGIRSTEAISFSYTFSIFIGLMFAYTYSKIKLSKKFFTKTKVPRKEKRKIFTSILVYSWPLVVFGIMGIVMTWIDTILIGYFKDAYLVGIYSAMIPIAILLSMSQDIFVQMFFPMITREMYAKRMRAVSELSKQVAKWIFTVNMPLLIMILLFPGVFINILFGPKYLSASNSLRFLALGYFFYSMAGISSTLLLSKGKSKLILGNIAIVATINFVFNYFLIPIYGINGAAFSTCLSLSLLSILIVSESYYFNKIFPFRRKLINVTISAIIPTVILLWIRSALRVDLTILILLGIGFIVLYLLLILLTKALDINDIRIVKKILRTIRNKSEKIK